MLLALVSNGKTLPHHPPKVYRVVTLQKKVTSSGDLQVFRAIFGQFAKKGYLGFAIYTGFTRFLVTLQKKVT